MPPGAYLITRATATLPFPFPTVSAPLTRSKNLESAPYTLFSFFSLLCTTFFLPHVPPCSPLAQEWTLMETTLTATTAVKNNRIKPNLVASPLFLPIPTQQCHQPCPRSLHHCTQLSGCPLCVMQPQPGNSHRHTTEEPLPRFPHCICNTSLPRHTQPRPTSTTLPLRWYRTQ